MAILDFDQHFAAERQAAAPTVPRPFRPERDGRISSAASVYLPTGEHPVVIERVTVAPTPAPASPSGGAPSLFWHLRVTEGLYRGVRVALPTSTAPQALWLLRDVLVGLGVYQPVIDFVVDDVTGEVTAPRLFPLHARAVVDTYERNGLRRLSLCSLRRPDVPLAEEHAWARAFTAPAPFIPDLLAPGLLTALGCPASADPSALLCSLARACNTGTPWLGHTVVAHQCLPITETEATTPHAKRAAMPVFLLCQNLPQSDKDWALLVLRLETIARDAEIASVVLDLPSFFAFTERHLGRDALRARVDRLRRLTAAGLAVACIVTTPNRTGAFVADCPVLAASDVALSIPSRAVPRLPRR